MEPQSKLEIGANVLRVDLEIEDNPIPGGDDTTLIVGGNITGPDTGRGQWQLGSRTDVHFHGDITGTDVVLAGDGVTFGFADPGRVPLKAGGFTTATPRCSVGSIRSARSSSVRERGISG